MICVVSDGAIYSAYEDNNPLLEMGQVSVERAGLIEPYQGPDGWCFEVRLHPEIASVLGLAPVQRLDDRGLPLRSRCSAETFERELVNRYLHYLSRHRYAVPPGVCLSDPKPYRR